MAQQETPSMTTHILEEAAKEATSGAASRKWTRKSTFSEETDKSVLILVTVDDGCGAPK